MSKIKSIFCVILFCLYAPSILADGKVFSPIAVKSSPDIPSQRAIIAHENGIENLIIETTFNGEGDRFGWIIPLPNAPTKFKQTSTGFIKTLGLNIKPKIIHKGPIDLAIYATTIVTIVFFIFAISKKRSNRIALISLIVFVLLAACVFLPALGTVGLSNKPSLSLHPEAISISQQNVGNYLVTVLKPKTPESLDEWLHGNGFNRLSEKDSLIVEDYIKLGWCFVASKLKRQQAGLLKPHPILITFSSNQPIYPIRLTGSASDNIFLELFIIGDQAAINEDFNAEVVDQFYFTKKMEYLGNKIWLEGFKSSSFNFLIGHPDSKNFLYDGCWITKIAANLTPEQMQRDLTFKWSEGKSYRKKYFSESGRKEMAGYVSLTVWCVSLFVFALYFRWKKKIEIAINQWLVIVLLCSLMTSILSFGIIIYLIKPVPVKEVSFAKFYYQARQHILRAELFALQEAFFTKKSNSINQTTDDIKGFLKVVSLENSIMMDELAIEDSPGNFTISEIDSKIHFVLYSKNASPYPLSEIENIYFDDISIKKEFRSFTESKKITEILDGISNARFLPEMAYLKTKIFIYLYQQQPHDLIPILLKHLIRIENEKDPTINQKDYQYKKEVIFRMLACISHTKLPDDLQEQDSVDEFLNRLTINSKSPKQALGFL